MVGLIGMIFLEFTERQQNSVLLNPLIQPQSVSELPQKLFLLLFHWIQTVSLELAFFRMLCDIMNLCSAPTIGLKRTRSE